MTGEADGDLPLHDEAGARAKWRGGETLLEKGDGDAGPASHSSSGGAVNGAAISVLARAMCIEQSRR